MYQTRYDRINYLIEQLLNNFLNADTTYILENFSLEEIELAKKLLHVRWQNFCQLFDSTKGLEFSKEFELAARKELEKLDQACERLAKAKANQED